MGSGDKSHGKGKVATPQGVATSLDAGSQEPGWADGLRKLYDSVVDEPLPDSFKDLLAKLDDADESSKS